MPPRGAVTRERQKRGREDVKGNAGREEQQLCRPDILHGIAPRHVEDIQSDVHTNTEEEKPHHSDETSLAAHFTTTAVPISAAADLQNELRKHIDACQIIERDVSTLLQQREWSTGAMDTLLSQQSISPNDVIRINVGGELFTVPLRLLLGGEDGDNYFDVLFRSGVPGKEDVAVKSCLKPPLLDDTGALFLDRDPGIFRLILNYLRGYKVFSILSEDQLAMLKVDAEYFQIRSLRRELEDKASENSLKFNCGPGVSMERNRFRAIYSVALIGENFLVTGFHRITFQILGSEYVGIGLVSDMCALSDQEFHKTLNCCVYYMTGVFYSNFPHHRKEDRLELLEKDDYVTLTVDMNKRMAEYKLKNSTKLVYLGTARKLRFAVVMKLKSAVRIVPDEEVQRLSLFSHQPSSNAAEGVGDTATDPPLPDDRDALMQFSQASGAGVSGAQGAAPSAQQE
uniref:BTB domain-containing protein n=1 Tax=Trypanosoma congolense (strain IL3000) TaxID=1068625 RepID=G0UUS8_TRYCI|nr:conserved hypothetical protein [Trypanosoma congolense IL3000]